MYTNAKIRIYPVGTYLLKVNNENSRTRCVICSKLTKKDTGTTSLTRTLRNIDVALVSQYLFLVFHTWISTCKDRCKLSHINQTDQTITWKKTCIEFKKWRECRLWASIYEIYWDFRSARIISLRAKKP